MEKKNYQSEFVLASEKDDIEEFKKHYVAVATKKEQLYFALYFASFNGREEVVKFLLTNKVDPNFVVGTYLTPLHAAIFKKHDSIVELLLQHGANVNPKIKGKSGKKTVETNYFCSPLICASYTGNDKVMNMLLKRGAMVNAKLQLVKVDESNKSRSYARPEPKDEYENRLNYGTFSQYDLTKNHDDLGRIGFTPLHFAVKSGKEDIAKILLDSGADLNARDDNDLTPLCLACQDDNVEMVKFLINAGADIKSQVHKGKHLLSYVLHCMILDSFENSYDGYEKHEWVERSKVFTYLLKMGVDPNGWSTKAKESVLHRAASDGIAHAVHLLLKYGANANAVDGEEKTPLEYSVEHLKDLLKGIQDGYCCISDSSSDDDYEDRSYSDPDEEAFYRREAEDRRTAREDNRQRQLENRKVYNLTHNTYTYNVWQYRRDHNHDEGFTIFKDPDPYRMVSQLLTRELVRLEALGKKNCQQNVKFLQTPFVKPYYTRCKNELKKLKKNVIADGVSYYDLLLANDSKLKDYMKNENIVSAIDEENCRKLFPNYCRFLKLNVKRGLKRKRSDVDEESDGSSDEDVAKAKGSVQMRGRAKRSRYRGINQCVLS